MKSPTCVDLVNNCPNLSSLSLRGFKLHDYKVRILVKVCTDFMLSKIITLLFFSLKGMLNGMKSCETFKILMNKLIMGEPGFVFLYSWSLLLDFFSLKISNVLNFLPTFE